ncbi:mRNA 3' end processing factor [Massospora cicadina]|nr:mRNA 3' end processing factor [Massospora cicadina]
MRRSGLDRQAPRGAVGCKVYADYLKRLNTLTSGSKPLITSLTLAAQALIYASDSIVRAVEEQIDKVEPSLKLPLLYLIDSVIKNHGDVYINGFKANIHKVFTEAYKKVQPDQREKFERVLATWNNSKIFPAAILDRINADIQRFKRQADLPARPNAQVLVNPRFVPKPDLALPKKPLAGDKRSNPNLDELPEHRRAFARPPMHRPLNQLGFEKRNNDFPTPRGTHPKAPPPRAFGPGRPHVFDNAYFTGPHKRFPERPPRLTTLSLMHPATTLSVPRFIIDLFPPVMSNLALSMALVRISTTTLPFRTEARTPPYPNHPYRPERMRPPMGGPPGEHPSMNIPNTPEPHTAFPPISGYISQPPVSVLPAEKVSIDPDLLKNLINSGMISLNAGSGPALLPPQPGFPDLGLKKGSTPTFNVSSLAALDEPPAMAPPVEPLSISLTQKDINLYREGAIKVLYDALSLQCRQCGLRYAEGEASQAKLDAHMDWHFRQNRKRKERVASRRFLSRAWFSADEDWAKGLITEFDYQNEPAFFNQASKPQTEIAQLIAKLEKSTVVVPADHAGQACPICQDKFTSCWSDEQEDWIYKNAITVDGQVKFHLRLTPQVCHATCHADPKALVKASASPNSQGSPKRGDIPKKRSPSELGQLGAAPV